MQPQASANPHSALLADLLGRAGAELGDLAAAVEQLHPLAAALASNAPATAQDGLAPDHVRALQGLDHIEQKLRALAGFLSDLARATDPDWRLDPRQALAAITLSDLASRLAGNTTPHNAPSGECELF